MGRSYSKPRAAATARFAKIVRAAALILGAFVLVSIAATAQRGLMVREQWIGAAIAGVLLVASQFHLARADRIEDGPRLRVDILPPADSIPVGTQASGGAVYWSPPAPRAEAVEPTEILPAPRRTVHYSTPDQQREFSARLNRE